MTVQCFWATYLLYVAMFIVLFSIYILLLPFCTFMSALIIIFIFLVNIVKLLYHDLFPSLCYQVLMLTTFYYSKSYYSMRNVNVNISLFGLPYSTISPCDSPLTNTMFCMQHICYICTDKCDMGCLCYNRVLIFSVHATC